MPCEYTLQQLAELVGGQVHGDPQCQIRGLNGFELAGAGEITFLLERKQLPIAEHCRATACVVPVGSGPQVIPTIECEQPAVAAARIHQYLLYQPFVAQGIHPSAVLGDGCQIPKQVSIGAQVALGQEVQVGERVTIHPGAVIGDRVSIGDDTVVHANVTIAEGCRIGKRVVLYHGAVIGSDGFGFATDKMGCHHSKPQVGTVQIDDDAQIGANACVDRAAFGVTHIKAGARIDNLVMIAHNVEVGENAVLAALTGVAGSSVLGRNVVLGGNVGIADHIELADQVMVAAKSGVHNSQPKGALLGGCPAIDVRSWGKASAAFSRLPEMVKEMRRLRKEVEQLKAQLDQAQQQKEDK